MSIKKILLSSILGVFAVVFAVGAVALANYPTSGSNAGSLGKTTLDTEVGWVIGSGQFDGEFITAESQGVVIGLRAQERFVGPIEVTGAQGDRVGVYEANTGKTGSATDNLGTWNYDWHVDLSDAKGNAKGKTLSDYKLVLEQDFTEESLFGVLGNDPVVLPIPAVCDGATATLCQQSWNPGFGNTDYDPDEVRTYNLRLVLIPETFNGQPLAVSIQVNVTD